MAIKRYAGDRYVGSSTDTKPTTATTGSLFYETDTHRVWLRESGSWKVWVNNSVPDTTSATYTYSNNQIDTIVSSIAGNTQTIQYNYNGSGQITTKVTTFLGYVTTVTFAYDDQGNITGFTANTVAE